ncbi:MAG: zf-TFIIB domain-containing protein, partial [Myxococcota bacterium]
VEFDDPEIDALILKSLHPEPHERFQRAQQMREAFLRYLDGRPAPRLPLETLRNMLRPAMAPDAEGASPGERPTAIGLPVPLRCGKCGGDFAAAVIEDVIVDRCQSCGGLWLEHDEVLRLTGPHRKRPRERSFSPAPLDTLVGSCPVDRIALKLHPVPGYPASLEVCPHCLGVWFDRGEADLLFEGDVSTWLRILLDTLGSQPT